MVKAPRRKGRRKGRAGRSGRPSSKGPQTAADRRAVVETAVASPYGHHKSDKVRRVATRLDRLLARGVISARQHAGGTRYANDVERCMIGLARAMDPTRVKVDTSLRNTAGITEAQLDAMWRVKMVRLHLKGRLSQVAHLVCVDDLSIRKIQECMRYDYPRSGRGRKRAGNDVRKALDVLAEFYGLT